MNSKIQLVEQFFIQNGQILSINSFAYEFPTEAKIVYEVIRVKNSTPLFFDYHMERLMNSIKILNFEPPLKQAIKEQIISLLEKNPIAENNLRISVIYKSASLFDTLIYFIPSAYPSETQKKEGVEVKLLKALRHNPNAKVENNQLRETANRIIAETKCYEVLLVNNEGFITEGSRSNLFFIKDNAIYTAPLSMVLGGITRLVVIELINKLGFSLIEEPVNIDQIDKFESAFLTGTSPSILPIAKIDDISYNTNHSITELLLTNYYKRIQDDIDSWI